MYSVFISDRYNKLLHHERHLMTLAFKLFLHTLPFRENKFRVFILWERKVLHLFNFFKVGSEMHFIPDTFVKWNSFAAPYSVHFGHWPLKFVDHFHHAQKETPALPCTSKTTLNLNAGRKCWSWSMHSHEREKDLKDAISWALGPEQRDPEDMLGILENDWYSQLGNRGEQRNVEEFLSCSVPFEIWFTILHWSPFPLRTYRL